MTCNRNHPVRAFRLHAVALGLLAATSAWGQSATVTNGTLNISTGPISADAKVVVGPAPGVVQVFGIAAIGDGAIFNGVRAINFTTGAGEDKLQFDIDSPQSLDLRIDTGSGTAETMISWRVPSTVASAVGTLDIRSGAGATKTFLNLESTAPDFRFGWNMLNGGGNKEVEAKLAYKAGSVNVANDIALSLGGGTHKVAVTVENEASKYGLRMNSGNATELATIVQSPNRTSALNVDLTSSARTTMVDIQSAADALDLALGGNYGPVQNSINYSVVQLRPAAVNARLGLRTGVVNDKIEMKFDGETSRLSLGGFVETGAGNDELKIESNMVSNTTLAVDVGAGSDVAELFFKGPLFLPLPGLPRLLGGDGNDQLRLIAERGATGQQPRIDCGPGFDAVRGFGVILNCETSN